MLSFPQFLELVALLSFALGDPRRGESSTLASLGVSLGPGGREPPLLHRFWALFYHCYSIGATFAGEAARLLRACATELRVLMAEAEGESQHQQQQQQEEYEGGGGDYAAGRDAQGSSGGGYYGNGNNGYY